MSEPNYDHFIWKRKAFPNKVRDDEDILLLVRQDIAIIIFRAISLYLVFFVLLIFRSILQGFITDVTTIQLFDGVMYGVASILIVMFAYIFHNYYLSLQIITSERIIDIDQKGLFNREVNVLSVENIQDVNFKKNTFFGTILNFGDVILQTSGEAISEAGGSVNGFVFNNIPHPEATAHLINELYQKNKDADNREQAALEAEYLKKALEKSKILQQNQIPQSPPKQN